MNVGEKGYHVGNLSCDNCDMANGLLRTASTGQYSTIFYRRDIKKIIIIDVTLLTRSDET